MITASDNPEVLREKIKEDIDRFDIEELREINRTIATLAAERASKLADKIWVEKGLSREKIKQEVERYRKSKR